jgi:DNA-3-methyladenine glycosylase I
MLLAEWVNMEATWKPPEWWYRGKRPPNDDAYFENMSRIIFQAGLNWSVIENKWPTMKQAFAQFSIEKVAQFTNADIERLMNDKGVVRNKRKIQAIIQNANLFKDLKKQHGSFQAYLDSLDKSNNYARAVQELGSRFKWLGPSSASLFLYSVGENINHSEAK